MNLCSTYVHPQPGEDVGRGCHDPAMTYVRLGQLDARPVRVMLDDGQVCDGWLEAYRKQGEAWQGYVRYDTAPGDTRLGWFSEGRIERV